MIHPPMDFHECLAGTLDKIVDEAAPKMLECQTEAGIEAVLTATISAAFDDLENKITAAFLEKSTA